MISLTLINYLLAPVVMAFGIFIVVKNSKSINSILILLFSIPTAISGFFIGFNYDLVLGNHLESGKIAALIAVIAIQGAYLLTLRLSLSFPYEKPMPIWNVVLFVWWIAISIFIVTNNHYIVKMILKQESVQKHGATIIKFIYERQPGPYYKLISMIGALTVITSIIIHLIRQFRFKNPIFKLQSRIIMIGTGVSILIGTFISIILPMSFGIFEFYPLSSLTAVIIVGSLLYGITTTRLFDIRSALYKTLLFLLLISSVGLLAGGIFAGVHVISAYLPRVAIAAILLALFPVLILLQNNIRERISGLFRRKADYQESLSKSLDKIDFSKGKDTVRQEFESTCLANIGTSQLNILVENNIGELVTLRNSEVILENSEPFIQFLINKEIHLLFKTEVISNPDFAVYRAEMMDLFLRLQAEAILFFFEGTMLIGSISFGSKENGSPFASYDYKVLKLLSHKFFVFIYYFRNIEKQSVALTVEKELKMSTTIIDSILQNLDTITHPSLDITFLNRSTKGLGGDFIDTIKITNSKYLIIIGDVAGKGINASMSMVILRSVIRTFIKQGGNFKSLVIKVNSFIKKELQKGIFFAGVFFLLDIKQGILFFINCGIPLIAYYSNNYKTTLEIQGEGRVLGVVKNYEKYIQIKKTELVSGDSLIITTDGILEAKSLSGEVFGKKKIVNYLKESKDKPAKALVNDLFNNFLEFTSNEINDDITMFGLKWTGSKVTLNQENTEV